MQMPVQCRLSFGRAVTSRDRQQVSAGARASPCWIDVRHRPTRPHYACKENICNITAFCANEHLLLLHFLIRTDLQFRNQLAPFLTFVPEQDRKFGGIGDNPLGSERREAIAKIRSATNHLRVALDRVADFLGRACSHADAIEGRNVVAGQRVGNRWVSGAIEERLRLVTPSALTLPSRAWPMIEPMVSNIRSTLPPTRSVSAGELPR